MIVPESVRDLRAASVIMAASWVAYRLPRVGQRDRFWQVTGQKARLTDPEMIRFVAASQSMGDLSTMVVRDGVDLTVATAEELDEIADDVAAVLEDLTVRATYGLGSVAVRSVEYTVREKFRTNHPILARILDRKR